MSAEMLALHEEKLALHDETQRPPIPMVTVQKAAHIIDTADAPRLLDLWHSQDHPRERGGRPAYISMRAVLIVWLILAMENQPMHITRVTRVFLERLTPATAAVLGYEFNAFTHPNAIYDRARSATTRVFGLIDAEPLKNRHRRLTVAEWHAELQWRQDNADIVERRRRRRDILQNMMLEASYLMLPAKYRTWNISIAVDATRVKTHARGIGKDRLAALPDYARVSSEPDAGFYIRNSKGEAPSTGGNPANGKAPAKGKNPSNGDAATKPQMQTPRIIEFAQEAEFAVTGSNGGSETATDTPNLVIAFAMHAPGHEPVAAARRMVDSLWERGHDILHFAGDRAYLPAGDPDVLQNPLRRAGTRLVMDYPIDQLGVQQNAHGAILVEGSWYSPGMPKHVIDATRVYREELETLKKRKDLNPVERDELSAALEAMWRARLAERRKYRVRVKDAKKANGKVSRYCPAAGPKPLLKCAMKPAAVDTRRGNRPLLEIDGPKRGTPPICAQQSVDFDIADGGSHEQHYEFAGDDWANHYHHLRNNVESFNAFVKDTATFALALPGRRRMRGATAQSLLMVLVLVAANLTKIRQFLEHKKEQEMDEADQLPPTEGRSRRSRKTPAQTRLTHRTNRNTKRSRTAPSRT